MVEARSGHGGDAAMAMTNLRRYGTAPFRVAVVHGGPGARGSVAPVARELARAGGVLEPLQAARSVDGQVAELGDVLARAAVPPVVLIGHSWGAWLAALLAARRPDLAGKLILVSAPAFEERYVAQLRERRLARLDAGERAEFERLVRLLEAPGATGRDALLARLGRLAAKADGYDPVEDGGDAGDALPADGEAYDAVWPEAAALRRSGALLAEAGRVACPVVAIHGAADPSPAAGVDEPLRAALRQLRFVLLERCGHTPWTERHARGAFFALLREEAASAR